jgi:uncharacterized membrane protein HdeD (DUF308 family)
MSSRFIEQGEERGFWPCMFLTFLSLVILMLFPFTPMQMGTWPLTVLVVLLIVGTFFGCGKIFRGRPQFQFHYHGEHTVVMEEIGIDMMERDLIESGMGKDVRKKDEENEKV